MTYTYLQVELGLRHFHAVAQVGHQGCRPRGRREDVAIAAGGSGHCQKLCTVRQGQAQHPQSIRGKLNIHSQSGAS